MSNALEKAAIIEGAGFPPLPEEWPELIPLEAQEPIKTGFPIDALPAPVAAFVEELAESTQTPDEMAALLSLGVLSTALQGRYMIQITPDWKEPLCLYVVAIAPPGERKSAVINSLIAPVQEYEAEIIEREAEAIAADQAERRMLEKALQFTEKSAANGKASLNDLRAAAADLENFNERHPFRLLADDTTPEKLVNLMAQQDGKLTIFSSEGGVFDAMTGRYEKSLNLDIYLKAHAGEPVRIDRVGRAADYIKESRLTMLLTIQPDVLAGFMSNSTFRGRGLCGRFLYALCRSKVGARNVDPDPVDTRTRLDYREFVRTLLEGQQTGTIAVDEEARALMLEYSRTIEHRLGNEWEHMRDWGGKLVGAMLRIAALIHIADARGNPESVLSEGAITAAIKIAEYLGIHAQSVYQMMGADASTEDARYLWKRIRRTGATQIKKRDLFQDVKGKFGKVEKMEPALTVLSEHGYIKEADLQTGGRPSRVIMVNPSAIGF